MTDTLIRHEEPAPAPKARQPRIVTEVPSQVDRWFNRITLASGITVLVLLLLVGVFLLVRSRYALDQVGIIHFLTSSAWRTDVKPADIGVVGLLSGTVLVAVIAVALGRAARHDECVVHQRVLVAASA